ncbi:syntaxin-binding protein 1 [Fistulifera solaris]|uniref:Syntaxin-binding protein 1 n=1 Tax=Fistulifera solaris TaxID=1519565 RepID=A0A1Z5J5T5_FISSO|nr:syntaxin-binding protein 1 [Fistulifera solaris]|eukprot:GAX09355.1 syntaxin-binding protein 1 [Fistulifera solaris]
MRVISSAVGMYDIMERKITIVESLNKKRAPFPDMGAVYVLEPSSDSISKLLQDFDKGKVLYGNAVFLYFLGRLPDNLLDQIKGCKQLLKRLKALAEINIDFLAKEERAFSFDMRDCFGSFYLRKAANAEVRKIADRLVTVCGTLNEYPHIRYKQSSTMSSSLAQIFHRKMDDFVAQNPNWWYHGGPKKGAGAAKERGTLLLLDRADDALTPLMHDFYYQSMVRDLLPMDGDRITFKDESVDDPNKTEDKDVLLDEKDKLWVEIRGFHIAQVIHTLSERIREMVNSSAGSAFGGKSKGDMTLAQMAAAMKALPEYKEVMSKLTQHMHIAHECMDALKKDKLMDLANLEQTLATGTDEDGNAPKLPDLIDAAEDLIMNMKNVKDRLRLILIITISQGGLRQQDRRRLMNAAELTRKDMRTLNSLEVLGLSLFASPAEKKGGLASLFGRGSSAGEDDEEYAATRYKPRIKAVLESLANGTLSLEEYPSVLPMPESAAAASKRGSTARGAATRRGVESARKKSDTSSRWNKSSVSDRGSATSGTGAAFGGGRCIVFMLGGLAYSEIRVAREVMKSESTEIIIGSTAFVSPKEYMNELESLGEDVDE